jgi:gas vesicle protein
MFGRKTKPERAFGRLALTFTAGALAGGAAALLLAPFSGKKMQKKLVDLKDEVVEVVGEKVHEVQDKVRKITTT